MLYDILLDINNFASKMKPKYYDDDTNKDKLYLSFDIDEIHHTSIMFPKYDIITFIVHINDKIKNQNAWYNRVETADFFVSIPDNSFALTRWHNIYSPDQAYLINECFFHFNNIIRNILKDVIKRNYAL